MSRKVWQLIHQITMTICGRFGEIRVKISLILVLSKMHLICLGGYLKTVTTFMKNQAYSTPKMTKITSCRPSNPHSLTVRLMV